MASYRAGGKSKELRAHSVQEGMSDTPSTVVSNGGSAPLLVIPDMIKNLILDFARKAAKCDLRF